MYANSYSIVFKAEAEAFPRHYRYFDAVWFHLSHPSTGEAFDFSTMIPPEFSPRLSTSTGMFPIQQSTIATDMKTQEEMVETPCHLLFCPDN